MTVRVFSDQAGTTAAAANDNIGKVEDLSKFDSDGVSSTTGPYLSVDANGFGSADILGQGGDVVQTFTNAIADGSALVVGTSKCIFFSNVNVEAGGTLTIGRQGGNLRRAWRLRPAAKCQTAGRRRRGPVCVSRERRPHRRHPWRPERKFTDRDRKAARDSFGAFLRHGGDRADPNACS